MANLPDESLYDYAKRMIDKYGIEQADIVVGLSFGGLVAQQIGEIIKLDFIILISSFRTKDDLKIHFSSGLKMKLHKLMPEMKSELIGSMVATYLNSGSKISVPVLKEMVMSTDMKLMKWSLEKIYEQDVLLAPDILKYSIIGDKDKVVKPWIIETTYIVEDGSHFMVFDKAKEVTKIISSIIG